MNEQHGTSATPPSSTESAYRQIGGAPAVRELVDRLYELLLVDPELAPYFEHVNLPQLKRHMVLLLIRVLGGPDEYEGRDLAAAHRHLGISREHYWRVSLYLYSVMFNMNVPMDIAQGVGAVLAGVEDLIVAPSSLRPRPWEVAVAPDRQG
jgi:hemoglobin